MSIRIVIVDDHAVLREGLKVILENNGMSVVGEAENGAEAMQVARKVRPQVVVMDLAMPVQNHAADRLQTLGIILPKYLGLTDELTSPRFDLEPNFLCRLNLLVPFDS